jgi:hypothetical protein
MVTLHGFSCATQDVAIGSLAVSTLKIDECGLGSGFMFAGQYFGIMLGGGAVFVAGRLGFHAAPADVGVLLLLILSFVLLVVRYPHAQLNARHMSTRRWRCAYPRLRPSLAAFPNWVGPVTWPTFQVGRKVQDSCRPDWRMTCPDSFVRVENDEIGRSPGRALGRAGAGSWGHRPDGADGRVAGVTCVTVRATDPLRGLCLVMDPRKYLCPL